MTLPADLIKAAEAYRALPYVFGAKGPDAYDCSGLITQAMADVGVEFPHGSVNQVDACVEEISPASALSTSGAVLYMPGHIAISKGDGTTIEARNPDDGIGNFSAKGRGWTRAGLLPVIGESVATLSSRAVASARAVVGGGGHFKGMCEQFVRTRFGFSAMYASAKLAWDHAGGKHVGDYNAPAGVPVFWDIVSGPNAKYDHIALSVGGGMCVSTTVGPGGTVGLISIKALTKRWGMKYRGWAEVYHGVRVYTPPKKPAATGKLRVDGNFGPLTIKELQRFLTRTKDYSGLIDGKFGPMTVTALQRHLTNTGHKPGRIDGKFGPLTVRAWQRRLTVSKGRYRGLIDGKLGPLTVKALQRFLNSL